MINFNKYPRKKEVTYTILSRSYVGPLRKALELANETDWQTRTCKVHDKSMLDDIKEHLPEWFDARYIVLISHFESQYLQDHINEICEDKDVKKVLAYESKLATKECMEYYRVFQSDMKEEKQKREREKCSKKH